MKILCYCEYIILYVKNLYKIIMNNRVSTLIIRNLQSKKSRFNFTAAHLYHFTDFLSVLSIAPIHQGALNIVRYARFIQQASNKSV